jgi:LPS-assembly lipoprotein
MKARIILSAAVATLMLAGLAGCGFRPLYGGDAGGSAASLAQIRIANIPDRPGQQLRNLLLDRLTPLGPPARPAYELSVVLREARHDLAIRKDESATRANLVLTASFVLVPADARDARRFAGSAVSTNSFNRVRSDFAALSAENDARNRALRVLAEEIRLRIAAALQNPAAFTPVSRPPAAAPAGR